MRGNSGQGYFMTVAVKEIFPPRVRVNRYWEVEATLPGGNAIVFRTAPARDGFHSGVAVLKPGVLISAEWRRDRQGRLTLTRFREYTPGFSWDAYHYEIFARQDAVATAENEKHLLAECTAQADAQPRGRRL